MSLHSDTNLYVFVEIIPRSILLVQFEGINYLLVTLGDGTLIYFTLNSNTGKEELLVDIA